MYNVQVSSEIFDAVAEHFDTYGEVPKPYGHPFGEYGNLYRCVGWRMDTAIVEIATDANGNVYLTGRSKVIWDSAWLSKEESNALRDDVLLSEAESKDLMKVYVKGATRPRPPIVTAL